MFWQRLMSRCHTVRGQLQQSSVQSTAGHGLIRLQHPPQDSNNRDSDDAGLRNYVATAPIVVTRNASNEGSSNDIALMPPALVLRGQYDFVLASNSLDLWGDLLLNGSGGGQAGNTEYITLAGTSHYAMVEQENLFGSVMQVFFQKHDPAGIEVPAFLRPGAAPASRQHSSQQRHKNKHKHQYLDSPAAR
jgi:pimeloyl-ACP methyl ester carboxylesterase